VTHKDPDHNLITKILNGDESCRNELIVRHKDYAYTIAYNVLNNAEEAEEVAHDAFVKAFKSLHKFNQEAKFSTWLYRIVFNTAISQQRRQKRKHSDLDEGKHVASSENNSLELQDRQKYIEQAMLQLNELDRTSITLFYFDEMSLEDIAKILDMNVATIKVRLHRARKRLAKAIQEILKEEALTL